MWNHYTRIREAKALGLTLAIKVPEFTLTGQDGTDFRWAQARGKIVVADFIYTRCALSCPTLTLSMAKLQAQFPALPRASNSFPSAWTPSTTGPRSWRPMPNPIGVDPANWAFLTGTQEQINDLIENGFDLPVEALDVDEPSGKTVDIPHSSAVALVDRQGVMRAVYEGSGRGQLGSSSAGHRIYAGEVLGPFQKN